jgi:hypothetical protein
MKYFLVVITVILTKFVFSQSTLIVYNYHNETYSFYKLTKNGDTIQTKRPYSYKGIPVKVIVKDLNTFCYEVTFTSQSFEEKPLNSEQNIETLISSYGSGLKTMGTEVKSDEQEDDYNSLYEEGSFQGVTETKNVFGMGPDEFEKEYEILETQTEILDQANNNMIKASKKIESILDFIQLTEFTNKELIKLRSNPNLTEAEMKRRATELSSRVFENTVELNQVIAVASTKSNELERHVGDYITAYRAFENQTELIKNSIGTLETKVKNDNFKSSVDNLSKQVSSRYESVKNNYLDLKDVLDRDVNSEIRAKLMEVYTNYDEIMNADFNYEYTLNTDKDVTRLTMKFGKPEVDTLPPLKTRYIDIPTQGGLRVNSSAGLSFISYFNGQSTYFNDGGYIGEETGDLFRPSLTTMFHFYRQSYKPFTLGGSFGLSVPVEGEKQFIYMTGLSGIIGKTQRVIVNVGAFGGKISRLDQGMRVGDELNSIYSEVPERSVFDFGLYVGLTFNISSFF